MTNERDSEHNHVAGQDVDWDEMYRESEQRWSGHVNGSLVAEIDGLSPGRALDVGCGEGADAIWLAEQGWAVTGIDISPTAIDRAATEAQSRGLTIDWGAADIVDDPPALGTFDLVALHYAGFPIDRLDDVASMLMMSVAPGGTLLVVGHAPLADPSDSPFDRADWVQAEDIAAKLNDSWNIEVDEVRSRPGEHHHHHGSPHLEDVILKARKNT